MAASRRLKAERAPGLGSEALERRRVHLGARPQDESIDAGRGVGVDSRPVGHVEAGWSDADLEPPQLRRPRVLLGRVGERGEHLLRVIHAHAEAVPAVALRTARRYAGAVRPPTTTGTGACTGRGIACTLSNATYGPL